MKKIKAKTKTVSIQKRIDKLNELLRKEKPIGFRIKNDNR